MKWVYIVLGVGAAFGGYLLFQWWVDREEEIEYCICLLRLPENKPYLSDKEWKSVGFYISNLCKAEFVDKDRKIKAVVANEILHRLQNAGGGVVVCPGSVSLPATKDWKYVLPMQE